ncbi:MAG: hypothetical protein ABIO14_09430 [Aeromicrobium sp.]
MTEPQDAQPKYPSYPTAPATPPGQQPYPTGQPPIQGQHPPFQPYTPAADGKRPSAVTAAAWITIILSILSVIGAFTMLALTQDMIDYVRDHPKEFDIQASDLPADSDLKAAGMAVALILSVFAGIAILSAFAVLKRQAWARVILAILSGVAAIVAIPFTFGIVGLPWLAGAITVIVLLFTKTSSVWFNAPKEQLP